MICKWELQDWSQSISEAAHWGIIALHLKTLPLSIVGAWDCYQSPSVKIVYDCQKQDWTLVEHSKKKVPS